MRDKPIILKLGGSAITRKDKFLTPRLRVIERLAKEISEADVSPIMIVHGGGSYGHPLAEKYNLTSGFTDSSQLIGLAKTHEAMTSLNKLVVKALIDFNIPAFGMPPSSFMLMKQGCVEILETESLTRAIEIGLMPVLYGDVAFDLDKGFNILSGDKIAASLAVRFGAERVVMAVDVDGIFTSDPKIDRSAQLIRNLTLENLKSFRAKVEGSKIPDVTGGMVGKLLELATVVRHGVEAVIVNALEPNSVYRALKGEEFVGTKITST